MKHILSIIIAIGWTCSCLGQGLDLSKVDFNRYDKIAQRSIDRHFLFRKHADFAFMYVFKLYTELPPSSERFANDSLYQAVKALDTSEKLLKAICPPDYEQKQFWKNNIHNIIVYDKTLAVKGCMEPPKKRIYEDLEVLHFRHNSTSTFTAARFSNHNSAVIRAYISNKWDYIFTLNDSHQPLNVYLYFAVKNGIVYVIDLFRDTFGTYTYEEYLARYGFDDIWIYAILLAP